MSSIGRSVNAVLARACSQSNFMFWRDLENAGVFEQRLQPRERVARRRIWPGSEAAAPNRSPPSPLPVAERDVAGAARRRRASEMPTSSACIGSSEVVSVSIATWPASWLRAIQRVELVQGATRSRSCRVDRRVARRLGAGGGELLRSQRRLRLARHGLSPLAARSLRALRGEGWGRGVPRTSSPGSPAPRYPDPRPRGGGAKRRHSWSQHPLLHRPDRSANTRRRVASAW